MIFKKQSINYLLCMLFHYVELIPTSPECSVQQKYVILAAVSEQDTLSILKTELPGLWGKNNDCWGTVSITDNSFQMVFLWFFGSFLGYLERGKKKMSQGGEVSFIQSMVMLLLGPTTIDVLLMTVALQFSW